MTYEITTNPSLTPSIPVKDQILSFLSTFYQTSDTESEHDKYVSSFTPDATLVMGSKRAAGSDGTFSPSPSPSLLFLVISYIRNKLYAN